MIRVTKTYLPPREAYDALITEMWESGWITNNGKLVVSLEQRLAKYLGVKHAVLVSNGTVALQLGIKALELKGEMITTPFSYVATVNSILWEQCTPRFVDINPTDLCMDEAQLASAVNENTCGIMPVHVYGYPCNVEAIQEVASRHNLPVIYDAAHAFGVQYKGQSLLKHGTMATLSLHATKLFHTVEGGAIITEDDDLAEKLKLYRAFGHYGDEYFSLGTNAKLSEPHAAMGHCVLDAMPQLMAARKMLTAHYHKALEGTGVQLPQSRFAANCVHNHAYFPVVFASESQCLQVKAALEAENIFPRRYFYPSLNKLPHHQGNACAISEDIALRVMCLPLFHDLKTEEVDVICGIVRQNLG